MDHRFGDFMTRAGRYVVLFLAFTISTGCDTPPQSAEQLRNAVHLLLNGRPEDALVLCNQILVANPDHSEAYLLRGEVYETLGNERKAIESYYQALRVKPDSEQAAASLAKFNALPAIEDTDYDQTLSSDTALGPLLVSNATNTIDEFVVTEKERSPWDQLAERNPSFDLQSSTAPPQEENHQTESLAGDTKSHQGETYGIQASPLLSGLQQAIEEGRRLDQLAKECESQHEEAANTTTDPEHSGRIVRFDLGLDIVNQNNDVSGTRTTGQPIRSNRSAVFSFSPDVRATQPPPSSGVNQSVFGKTRRC